MSEVTKQERILIDIGYRLENVKDKFNKVNRDLQSQQKQLQSSLNKTKLDFLPQKRDYQNRLQNMKEQMNSLLYTTKGTRRKRWSAQQKQQLERLQVAYKQTGTKLSGLNQIEKQSLDTIRNQYTPSINKLTKQKQGLQAQMDGMQKSYRNQNNSVKKASLSAKESKREFQGWAMSIMFAGMAIQRAFMGIWKSGMKTFNEVHSSIEGTTTGFTKLQGSMKYLWFSVGQALEPLAEWLIPIVDRITDWVQANPKLTKTITALGVALGTIFMVGGSGVLAINGFIELGMKLDRVKQNATNLKNFGWKSLGKMIQKGVGAIAIGFAVGDAVDSFKNFKEGKWVDGLLNAVASGLQAYGGLQLLKGGKKGLKRGSIAIAVGLIADNASNNELFTNIFSTIGLISAAIAGLGKWIVEYFKATFEQGFTNALLDALKSMINNSKIANLMKVFGLGDKVDKATDIISSWKTDSADVSGIESLGSYIKGYYSTGLAIGKKMDEDLKSWKDSAQLDVEKEYERMYGKSYDKKERISLLRRANRELEGFRKHTGGMVTDSMVSDTPEGTFRAIERMLRNQKIENNIYLDGDKISSSTSNRILSSSNNFMRGSPDV